MLHPKFLVLATPEVCKGAPILAIICSPDFAMNGETGGWMFLHVRDTVPDDANPHFFEDVPDLDPAARTIVENATPGIYLRESQFAPFKFERGDDSTV